MKRTTPQPYWVGLALLVLLAGGLLSQAVGAREHLAFSAVAPDACTTNVETLKLQYLGGGCPASGDLHASMTTCSGSAGRLEPVDVTVDNAWRARGAIGTTYADVTGVFVGDVVDVSAANAGEHVLGDDINIVIGGGIEVIGLHNSCAEPVRVGDRIGSMRVLEIKNRDECSNVADGDDDDDDDDSTCDLAKATPDLDGATLLLEGRFCDEPTVSIGQPGGEFETALILSSGPRFIEVELGAGDGTSVVAVECPCETCRIDVAIGQDIAGLPAVECPDGQCVSAIDDSGMPTCVDCSGDGAAFECPVGQCVSAVDDDGVPTCVDCAGGTSGPECPDMTSRIGSWCVENFLGRTRGFAQATLDCHARGRIVCPVDALLACDIIEPEGSACALTTDVETARLWTSTWDASFGSGIFDSLAVYGGDDVIRQGTSTDQFGFYCCEAKK